MGPGVRQQKTPHLRGFPMRPGRFELPRSKRTTRPSTLRTNCPFFPRPLNRPLHPGSWTIWRTWTVRPRRVNRRRRARMPRPTTPRARWLRLRGLSGGLAPGGAPRLRPSFRLERDLIKRCSRTIGGADQAAGVGVGELRRRALVAVRHGPQADHLGANRHGHGRSGARRYIVVRAARDEPAEFWHIQRQPGTVSRADLSREEV